MKTLFFSFLFLWGLLVFVIPFLPSLAFDVKEERFGQDLQNQAESNLVAPIPDPPKKNREDVGFASPVILASFNNRLVIPRIDVDVPLVEGTSWKSMENGAWRLPNSGTPDQKEGNTVISGHRFAFWGRNNKIFYYLDKLKTGDEIEITWQGEKFYYVVKGSKVVWPTNEEVLEQTRERKLTLLTCTPIGTANQRLVVEAIPVEVGMQTSMVK